MKKSSPVFICSLKFAVPAAAAICAAALLFGYARQAPGVLFGAAVTAANFFLLERMIRNADAAKYIAAKIFSKTIITVAVLLGGMFAFGAPGVFAGVLAATLSFFAAGLKVKKCR